MDVEVITNSIKQLVIGSGKFMQEANTFEQAEERIIHLEENDDQFHKYDLVKLLKAEIEECIGPIVDEEIGSYAESGHENVGDGDTLVARITEKVTKCAQFEMLKDNLSKAVHESVDRLVDNFEEEFRSVSKEESPPTTPRQKDPYQFSDDESTLSGSYNHGGFLFVTLEQLQKNIENLDRKNDLHTRRAALCALIRMSLSDILANDESYQREWASLERAIVDALGEHGDPELQRKGLIFISRGFSSSHGNSRELYSTLTTFLYEYFTSENHPAMKVKNGLDATKQDSSHILLAFRLMNDFQNHVPNFWVRYPTRFLDEVLERTLNLMSLNGQAGMSVQPSLNMTPAHFMALIDPMAQWFMRWTHGCYSRIPMFDIIKKQKAFLENLIKSILEFVASRRVPFDLVSEASESVASHRGTVGSHQQRITYTGEELEYFYLVHSINIVGRILMYKQGIRLFPLKIKGYEAEITISKLICAICQLVTNPAGHGSAIRNITAVYDPSIIASEVLTKLCSSESTYEACLCRDEVTNTLLMPVIHWLDNSVPDGSLATEATLMNVADILSNMASKGVGRRHLLYGERGDTFSRTRSSAAHCLTDFCKKALSKALPSIHGQVSKSVSGAYLFLCRQLYNNGEGLQAIYSYDLHNVLSQAWREASKAVYNASGDKRIRKDEKGQWWEDLLKDNLLNFATTPKGVLLMQQSTAMEACTEYMCKRHRQRQQVSSLEKFGYGSIITQIAGTACGMLELEKQGLIGVLCSDAWNSIEPGEHCEVPFQPKIWPVDAIDKSAHKPLVNLLHVFSNFTSVFELIGGEKLPVGSKDYTFRDCPSTLIELLNRVTIINTATDEAKIHFLFNFEQSHVFGLRLLNSLISCLDTQLLLDSQFKVVDTLVRSQTAEDSENVVIDVLTVERNHILARAMVVGGPSERLLPPQTIPNLPLITSATVPKEYLLNIAGKSSIKQETELSRFLSESKSTKLDSSWLEKCRTVFCKALDSKADTTKGNVLQDVLEKTVNAKSNISSEAIFTAPVSDSESGVKSFKLTTLQEYGVKKAIQYGVHLKLLTSTHESQESLTKLLRHVGSYLKQQQRQVRSNLRSLSHNYVGFDWFAATVFLMLRGSYERSWRLLQAFSNLSASAYLWAPRMHKSMHLPANLASSSIPPVLFSACHNVELLLQVELPLVYPAFRMSGFTAAQICQLWIRQCFWNFLDWTEICHYIIICTLLGIDYQVYMCVAILKHLQNDILHHQQKQDLIIFLREHPIVGFKVGKHLEYMRQLEAKYRKTVLPDMLNLSKP